MTEAELYDNPRKLGFGLMRLPRKGVSIDIEQTSRMVDMFLDAGCTYFDTAFVYPGSEAAAKKALIDRHPRDSYTLATKLFAAFVPTEKAAKAEFDTSLKRTGAEYFDYYLLHCLMNNNYKKYEKFDLWDFARNLKKEGKIRHYGFSFHAGPVLLDQILTEHPDVDFVQLQINYADWENPSVTSRENYEVARKHGKKIVIMEPVKGGKLADPPKAVKEVFRKVNPEASFSSWAIRFAASLDGVLTVLSGMSDVAQMQDNLSYMTDFKPLNAEERKAIGEAMKIMGRDKSIPCTGCHYCTGGCPKQIPIPEIFAAMNKRLVEGRIEESEAEYARVTSPGHTAADCISCGQCEKACPQQIKVIDRLKEVNSVMSRAEN